MDVTPRDLCLIEAVQKGLPLVARPYAAIGEQCGLSESDVIDGLKHLIDTGIIKRFGVIVRHHELGYRANAMVVWDIPDDTVGDIGRRFGEFDFVTLCYRRPRHRPDWPYNLFSMIHGQDRDAVLSQLDHLARACGLTDVPHEPLFSTRRFKQRGALYRPTKEVAA